MTVERADSAASNPFTDTPQVRPCRYAMTQGMRLIVDPSDHKIEDVVAPSK
jgi:hypothetical protein